MALSRGLTAGESALASSVFADAVDCATVRIFGAGFGRFAVTVGSSLFVPSGLAAVDYATGQPLMQSFFIHEMTHVWQFQTRPLWTLASWARALASGGYGPGLPGYRYALPLADWNSLNLEQQASVVEHAYLLREGFRSGVPTGAQSRDYAGRTPFPRLDRTGRS